MTGSAPSKENPPAGPELGGVVVHWRDEQGLQRLLETWPNDFPLVVVDNSASVPAISAGEGLDKDPQDPHHGRVHIVRPVSNLGFGGGVNRGVECLHDLAPECRFALILNPDAAPEPGAVEHLLDQARRHSNDPACAGVAPALLEDDGSTQHSWQLQPLPSMVDLLKQVFFLGGARGPNQEPAEGTRVEQPAAAVLMLDLHRLARPPFRPLFDDGFFPAWFDDVDLARRASAAGLHFRYIPSARFVHARGSSVPALGYGRFLWIYYRNLERYVRLHHGRGWALLARWLLPISMTLRLLALPLRAPARATGRIAAAKGLLSVAAGAVTGWRLPSAWTKAFKQPASSTQAPRADLQTPTPGSGSPSLVSGRGGWGVRAATPRAQNEPTQNDPTTVAILIVTYNSAADLPGCLESVKSLEYRPLELVIVDCDSQDDSVELARAHTANFADIDVTLAPLGQNLGFSGGMNAALLQTRAPFVLALNADARPAPDFIDVLVNRLHQHPRAAAVTGRLTRPGGEEGGEEGSEETILLDACGMYLSSAWRHFDRGSGEPDHGQLRQAERVFGATGAATLYRRTALEDVAFPRRRDASDGDGGRIEIFDEFFHSYREDAELCFRFHERGWSVIYEPAAEAVHKRRVVPSNRRTLPATINRHSLKNRYLLRAYHQTFGNALRTAVPTLTRDVAALIFVLLFERSSLGAYAWLWRNRARITARRRYIQGRRTEPHYAVDRWFRQRSAPLEES